jgi:hypothetical protein
MPPFSAACVANNKMRKIHSIDANIPILLKTDASAKLKSSPEILLIVHFHFQTKKIKNPKTHSRFARSLESGSTNQQTIHIKKMKNKISRIQSL